MLALTGLTACASTDEALVFASARSGDGDIYVLTAGQTAPRILTGTETGEGNPIFDTMRERIVYQAFPNDSVELRSEDVFLLEDPNGDAPPSWSPIANEIVYSSTRSGQENLYIRDLDAGSEIQLTTGSSTDRYPVYSPDGSSIVFARKDSLGWRLTQYSIGSELFADLTEPTSYVGHPSWSPDGSKIAFDMLYDGQAEIALVDVETSNVTRLTDRPGNDLKPNWSLDGSRIVFGSDAADSDWDIYEANVETKIVRRIISSPGFDGSAIYVPVSILPDQHKSR